MKSAIWSGMILGSVLGSLVPLIWGAGTLSFSSLLFSALGAVAGIVIAFKLTH